MASSMHVSPFCHLGHALALVPRLPRLRLAVFAAVLGGLALRSERFASDLRHAPCEHTSIAVKSPFLTLTCLYRVFFDHISLCPQFRLMIESFCRLNIVSEVTIFFNFKEQAAKKNQQHNSEKSAPTMYAYRRARQRKLSTKQSLDTTL